MSSAIKRRMRLISSIFGLALLLLLVAGMAGVLMTRDVINKCDGIAIGDAVAELHRLENLYWGSVAMQEADYSFDKSKPFDPNRKTYQLAYFHSSFLSNAVCIVEHDGVRVVWRGLQSN